MVVDYRRRQTPHSNWVGDCIYFDDCLLLTTNPITANGLPATVVAAPAEPLTRAG